MFECRILSCSTVYFAVDKIHNRLDRERIGDFVDIRIGLKFSGRYAIFARNSARPFRNLAADVLNYSAPPQREQLFTRDLDVERFFAETQYPKINTYHFDRPSGSHPTLHPRHPTRHRPRRP